jgi:hypothetical protein
MAMFQRRNTAGLSVLGLVPALAVVAALLLAGPARAAAPPPAAVAERPLFDDPAREQPFVTNPVRMVLSVVGTSSAPVTGRWAALATVYAGQHPRVDAWDLTNPLTQRYSRIPLGAASAVLAGFPNGLPAPGLAAVLGEFGTLVTGDYLGCWALQDTDVFRNLPDGVLRVVRDNTGLSTGTPEAESYDFVVVRAFYTSARAFAGAVRHDLTYTHLMEDSERYRGEVVRVEGLLRRINRHPPTWRADNEGGVRDLYEAWIFPESLGAHPYCVLFVEWPAGLPRDVLGKEKINQPPTVRLDGYFFKRYRYDAAKNGGTRDAPLVIGHTLVVLVRPDELAETKSYVKSLVVVFLVLVAGVLFGVLGLTYWYRRNDNAIRRRLLQARAPEFILPPPDAMPVAPLASPLSRSHSNPSFGSRFNLPADRSERLGDRPREPGGGDEPERPPDEGAGS